MKYLSSSVILSVFIIGFFLQSCSKEDFDLSNANNSLPNSITFDTNVAYSPKTKNPYDFVGKYHNEGLQFVIDEYQKKPKLKSEQDLEVLIKDLTISYMAENNVFTSSDIKTPKTLSNFSIMDKINLKQVRLKSADVFSKKDQQIYFNKLMKVYNNKVKSPQELIDYINEVECDILKDVNLTEEEQSELLITTAVAKYSSIFWIETFLKDIDMEPVIRLKNGSESGDNFEQWWNNSFMPNAQEIIQSDFEGAATGAVAGAIFGGGVGTVVQPGGGTITLTITGAVQGGAQGAIVGSAWQGAKILFQNLF